MSHLNEVELAKLMMTALGQLSSGQRTVVGFTPSGDWTHDTVVEHSQGYTPLGKRLVWTRFEEPIEDASGLLWELSFERMDTQDMRVCTLAEALATQRAMKAEKADLLTD